MERPLRPAGRLPRPARRPLVRLRATHQGPYRAREGTTRGIVRHAHYGMTRVNQVHAAPATLGALGVRDAASVPGRPPRPPDSQRMVTV